MTATVDTNILVYASDADSPRQPPAYRLLESLADGPALTTLFWPTVLGYVRIATNPRTLRYPLSYDAATANVKRLISRPNIRMASEEYDFWSHFTEVSQPVQPTGNLVPDAHLVALMRQHGVREIWTRDRDLRKFDDIIVRDPFV